MYCLCRSPTINAYHEGATAHPRWCDRPHGSAIVSIFLAMRPRAAKPAAAIHWSFRLPIDRVAATQSQRQARIYPQSPAWASGRKRRDGLLVLIIAGIHRDLDAMNAVPGCRVIPAGSTTEVIERLPSGTDFMRVVKVKVTSPSMKATTGLTIEINR